MTLPITDPSIQIEILDALFRADAYPAHPPGVQRPTRAYEHARFLPLTSDTHVLIQAKPRRPGVAYARMEFNPSKAGDAGMCEFHRYAADLLPPGYAHHAYATRIDVAVDFYGVLITELAIRSRRHQKSNIWFGRRGEIETIYLGVRGSQTHFTVYDKARQLIETQESLSVSPRTRFEIRIRTSVPIADLARMRNPFRGIEVFCLAGVTPPETAYHWLMFKDSVGRRGLHAALKMLPPAVRRKYENAILDRPFSHWRPDDLWSGWPAAVEALGFRTITSKPDLGASRLRSGGDG